MLAIEYFVFSEHLDFPVFMYSPYAVLQGIQQFTPQPLGFGLSGYLARLLHSKPSYSSLDPDSLGPNFLESILFVPITGEFESLVFVIRDYPPFQGVLPQTWRVLLLVFKDFLSRLSLFAIRYLGHSSSLA